MNIGIMTSFEDNKIIFRLNLPIGLIDINEEEYFKLDDKIIYTCDEKNFDCNKFSMKINALKNIIKNNFSINEEIILTPHIPPSENNEKSFSFIKNNKEVELVFCVGDFKEIISALKNDDYPNLKIKFENSTDDITYKEFYDMYKKLNEIVEFINHYNLSPLEKVMLVYDIVKANEYKKEDKNESYGTSRNLNEIIKNDKIVCVGYSNLIDFLLTNLGIKSGVLFLRYENSKVGHERNYIYLNDDKYNIDGMFFLDATWDSRRNDNYIDNYTFFLKPIKFFKRYKSTEYVYSPSKFKLLEKSKEDLIKEIDNLDEINLMRFYISLSQLASEYKGFFDIISGIKPNSNEKAIRLIDEIIEKYNSIIPETAFKNALYRVRKIEYINGIFKQELTEEYIDEVCEKYYQNSAERKLLKALQLYKTPTLGNDLKISKAKSTEEDILRMRLLRAIKEKIDDKPDNDYIKKM